MWCCCGCDGSGKPRRLVHGGRGSRPRNRSRDEGRHPRPRMIGVAWASGGCARTTRGSGTPVRKTVALNRTCPARGRRLIGDDHIRAIVRVERPAQMKAIMVSFLNAHHRRRASNLRENGFRGADLRSTQSMPAGSPYSRTSRPVRRDRDGRFGHRWPSLNTPLEQRLCRWRHTAPDGCLRQSCGVCADWGVAGERSIGACRVSLKAALGTCPIPEDRQVPCTGHRCMP
jgi:hypothetical protein